MRWQGGVHSSLKRRVKELLTETFITLLLNDKDFVSQMKIKIRISMRNQLNCQIRMLGGTK